MKHAPLRAALCLALTSFLLVSCGSTSSRVRGVPRNLPKIELYGSAQTPSHSMDKPDYPFDSSGDYVTAWASGGSSAASESDYQSWQQSHEGAVSRRQPSPVRKVSSAPKKKTATSSKKGSSSKKSSGGSYTIKKGDTLGAIAQRNGTTVSKLKAANGMTSDFIREGKSLKIPK